MTQKKEKISLSWHLTEREKQYVMQQASSTENLNELSKLKALLEN